MLRALVLLIPYILASAATIDESHPKEGRRCANASNVKSSRGRIAVGIAGLSRGINYTLPSIERHVFDALRRHNFEFDVIWSTVSNPAFFGHQMDDFEVVQARPCLFSIIPQETILESNFEKFCKKRSYLCLKNGKVYNRSFTLQEMKMYGTKNNRYTPQLKSYLCGFDSQKRLADLIRVHTKFLSFKYDAILMIRPDVAFIRDIDLPKHFDQIAKRPNNLWIPDFQHFSNGLNDRGAFGTQEVMLKYLERGDAFFSNNSYGIVIAEKFLSDYLVAEGITWTPSSMRFMRVRPMEDEGVDVGIIDHYDSKAKTLNVSPKDPDLLRCTGKEYKFHKAMKFEYKTINVEEC